MKIERERYTASIRPDKEVIEWPPEWSQTKVEQGYIPMRIQVKRFKEAGALVKDYKRGFDKYENE